MNWCKRDKRKCIREICSMRPQPKEFETYEDCPNFVIRGMRSKMNFYYDDFKYDKEELNKVLEIYINKNNKGV